MARSAVGRTAHEGLTRQAGAGAGSPNAIPESGRWEIAMNAASSAGRSAANAA
jgi:hypothetical protein